MIVYHTTDRDNIQSILDNGLLPGHSRSIWSDITAGYDDRYGFRPIYVSNEPGYGASGDAVLAIIVDESDLLPDYPSMYDDGGWERDTWAIRGPISPDRISLYHA